MTRLTTFMGATITQSSFRERSSKRKMLKKSSEEFIKRDLNEMQNMSGYKVLDLHMKSKFSLEFKFLHHIWNQQADIFSSKADEKQKSYFLDVNQLYKYMYLNSSDHKCALKCTHIFTFPITNVIEPYYLLGKCSK